MTGYSSNITDTGDLNGQRGSPLVSVIIPTYNRAKYVTHAIDSVLAQTYPNNEIIVVDDGSTDDTKEALAPYMDRIKYIYQENTGGAAARNTGIKAAKGELIAFLDSDDEWLPAKIEKQIDKFRKLPNSVGVVYSGCYTVSQESKEILCEIPTLKGNVHNYALQRCIISSPTPLIRKLCFKKVGVFDEALPSCQDWDMWIRLSKHYNFDFVPDILARFYCHGDQISADLEAKIEALEILVRKYKAEFREHPSIFYKHLRRLAVLNCLNGDPKAGRKYLFQALKCKPFQKGVYIYLLLLLLAPRAYMTILRKRRAGITDVGGIELYW